MSIQEKLTRQALRLALASLLAALPSGCSDKARLDAMQESLRDMQDQLARIRETIHAQTNARTHAVLKARMIQVGDPSEQSVLLIRNSGITMTQRGEGETASIMIGCTDGKARILVSDGRHSGGATLTGDSVTFHDTNSNPRAVLDGSSVVFFRDESDGKLGASLSVGTNGAGLMLCDENGKTRAMLSVIGAASCLSFMDEKDEDRVTVGTSMALGPNIRMMDENGQNRLGLAVNSNGVALAMWDKRGMARVGLSIAADQPGLRLYDEAGGDRAALLATEAGPGLFLHDKTGKARGGMIMSASGPGLDFSDVNGTRRALLSVNKDGPGLAMFEASGTRRAWLTVGEDGPGFDLSDEKGRTRALLYAPKAGPMLGLAGDNGRLFWSTPTEKR
jgi:hypothetical protein